MPYITPLLRQAIDQHGEVPVTAGELNYALTKVCLRYLTTSRTNYQAFNDIIGALEACKLEMYRRAVAPYEDTKIKENGDAYPQQG